ncbi:HpcH/HpaI aldolase/citrate lyase family protein [Sphingomonas japonica]|uniref:Citrate lyase subunit beta/citryl-CoA lyase n=1 Tax=Sphingomonas japonica TaxID=511662 RepID=A0ABX0U3C6_9SPHN|nr:aldolase/citrate lyase family protein [Sphingomonas japonica]NIJ25085.1 citrate lyase subunit beta/citryl-CoA lyase [Sphingomonas japonica]
MTAASSLPPRTLLFLPANRERAVAKARESAAEMIFLDLEDAVAADAKDAARDAAVTAARTGFGRPVAIRMNVFGSASHAADVAGIGGSAATHAILPKAEDPAIVAAIARAVGKPLLVMIETPRGVLAAAQIAATQGVMALIAGTNDLRAELRIPNGAGREAIGHALQVIVLAARAHGVWAIDGVFNALDDAAGLEAECRHGRSLGFDGKTLIHPDQIAIAARAFGPGEAEIEEAEALVAAASGGAERFRDRMIEAMHVDAARTLLARAGRR